MTASAASWTEFRPSLKSRASRDTFLTHARSLARAPHDDEHAQAIEELRDLFIEHIESSRLSERQLLIAAGLVLADLAMQGWRIRVRANRVTVCAPLQVADDPSAEKARIRRQELLKRDAQLRKESVQKFLRSMERPRLFNKRFTSVFCLMRDGRELAKALQRARESMGDDWASDLAKVVDPYLQFVNSEDVTCAFTGLRLMDIWRYFRHTWTNQYTTIPGRTMAFLVRDRMAPFHPIVGIGALGSPVMQISERDKWIGWHAEPFLPWIRANPTDEIARWLVTVVDRAVDEIYVDDLREDGILTPRDLSEPTDALIRRLLKEAQAQRALHYRYSRSRDHKAPRTALRDRDFWIARARTHLFRSKRALGLATLLRVRTTLGKGLGRKATGAKLAALAATGEGRDAIRKIVKKTKADRIGIAVADITVCGAIQPYNAILGGKLVAMLAASPEVVAEYRRRYASAESEIASGMAGHTIVRTPTLVVLGTTSLYGSGSSQYNRIKIPCDRLGGSAEQAIRYEELGQSEAYGTSQFSEETVDALVAVAQQSAGGQRVNSIFGEGVSPKLRKIRQGLDVLGLPSDRFLRHHRQRVVYAVSLIRNLRDYLLGIDAEPEYLFSMDDSPTASAGIVAWWRERWLRNRVRSDEVLAEVAKHTLIRPISHGARVVRPSPPLEQQELVFAEL